MYAVQLKRFAVLAVMVMLVGALSVMASAAAADGPVTVLDDPSQAPGEVVHVQIRNFAYNAAEVVIAPGTTVIWTNEDAVGHNVDMYTTDQNPLEESVIAPILSRGEEFAVTFNEEGVYQYLCDPHPFMTGTVRVES